MIRKIISIAIYIISGFFLLIGAVTAFIKIPDYPIIPVWLFLAYFIIGFILLIIAIAISEFKNWKHDTGILLITLAILDLFTIFTMVCFDMTPGMRAIMPKSPITIEYNYYFGGSYLVILGLVGILLTKRSRNELRASVSAHN
jgi:cation transport ATPase